MREQLDLFRRPSYHNTIPLAGVGLEVAERSAKSLESKVLKVFQEGRYKDFTPPEISLALGQQYPLTSIRRAITNLTSEGQLRKTEIKRTGIYGAQNNTWILNS
jgi:hypothetical protein